MKKILAVLLAAMMMMTCVMTACSGGTEDDPAGTGEETRPASGEDTQTGETTIEAPTETPTEAPTETPTETPTEPETDPVDPNVTHTVSFVNTVWETIPSIRLHDGETLTADKIPLPEGVTLNDGQNAVCIVPAGESFSGDFAACETVTLGEYVVKSDVTLALDLALPSAPLTSLADETRVNYYGRNYVTDDKVTFLNTAAGFEVRFNGTELKASFTLRGRGPVNGSPIGDPFVVRFRVYRDGDMSVENSTIITLDGTTSNKELVLASFEKTGCHRVLFRRISYDFWGYAELRSLTCDGGFCPAPAKPEKKILIFGDSLTVGYGNMYAATGDKGSEDPYWEDGAQTYAVMLADYCGAQIQMYCDSGLSMAVPAFLRWSFMDENRWKQYGYYDFGSVYDTTQYDPDLILLNLGTNDIAGLVNGNAPYGNGSTFWEDDHFTWKSIRDAYLTFFEEMRKAYPDARIVIIHGMLFGLDGNVSTAAGEAVRKGGFDNVGFCKMKGVELSENASHPTIAGNVDAFNQLLAFLEKNDMMP